jgi:predicted small integral membrane protein
MHIRYLKIMFAVLTSLMALFYATQNVANLEAALQSILYVTSGTDHVAYPNSFGPEFTSSLVAWPALVLILLGEYACGLLLARGAIDMWKARKETAEIFRVRQKWAEIGAGIGVFVWLGLFGVVGAAFFQMWQTEIGAGSMNGAFQYFVTCAITLIFLRQGNQSPDVP